MTSNQKTKTARKARERDSETTTTAIFAVHSRTLQSIEIKYLPRKYWNRLARNIAEAIETSPDTLKCDEGVLFIAVSTTARNGIIPATEIGPIENQLIKGISKISHARPCRTIVQRSVEEIPETVAISCLVTGQNLNQWSQIFESMFREANPTKHHSNEKLAALTQQLWYALMQQLTFPIVEATFEKGLALSAFEGNEEPKFRKELDKAIAELKVAFGQLQSVEPSDQKVFGEACDNYVLAAKNVAAVATAQRIRESFVPTIDDDGKSTENVDEKIGHAREIRDWLRPMNFGIESSAGYPSRLDASTSGRAKGGVYLLRGYGTPAKRETDWMKVREVLLNPRLVDATDLLRKQKEIGK